MGLPIKKKTAEQYFPVEMFVMLLTNQILQNQVSEPARMRTPHQTNVFTETADPNLILDYLF